MHIEYQILVLIWPNLFLHSLLSSMFSIIFTTFPGKKVWMYKYL
jgi:hypothetical protein